VPFVPTHCEFVTIQIRVRLIMEKDVLKNPLTNRNAASAQLLYGQIDRKLVKQTVMTSVYGVTFVGAQIQILSRLKERGLLADSIDMYRAAAYAAKASPPPPHVPPLPNPLLVL
jgi:DNA-directed RNA polymerase